MSSYEFAEFRKTLQEALDTEKVKFSSNIKKDFEPLVVYRKLGKNPKIPLTDKDFYSHVEKFLLDNNKNLEVNEEDIRYYACSFFRDKKSLKQCLKMKVYDKRIVEGAITREDGIIDESENSHVNCWLYKNTRLWEDNRFRSVK